MITAGLESRHTVPRYAVLAAAALAALLLAGCAVFDRQSGPEAGARAAELVHAKDYLIVAAHPLAAQAGRDILAVGGSAVDAAIAAQMVLTLVEPQSSGIGGGGFLLHHDAGKRKLVAYDGRETAPASAHPRMFLDESGKPKGFDDAVVGGRSVGVPGLVRMLALAHKDAGALPWADLFAPAIALAEQGFPMSPRLHAAIAADKHLKAFPAPAKYFHDPEGDPLPPGHLLRNPELAATLRAIAKNGADAFYTGPIAADIARTVSTSSRNPAAMTRADIANYRAVRRDPVCLDYRARRVCGMPPPSSGGITTLQILGLLRDFDMRATGAGSAASAHRLAEASRLAFADRNAYIGDPTFANLSTAGLLDPAYLSRRARLIGPRAAKGEVAASLRACSLSPPQRRTSRHGRHRRPTSASSMPPATSCP